jgi:Flp pilus assembly pilin Flp
MMGSTFDPISLMEDTEMPPRPSPIRFPARSSHNPAKHHAHKAADLLRRAWSDDQGQDIAEYAVMLAVILVIVVGTIRLIGSNANIVFSQAASSVQ